MPLTMKHTTKTVFAMLIALVLATCLAGLTSCQSGDSTNTTKSDVLTIGEQSDNAYELHMTNSAGKSVASMMWRLEGADTFSANMMTSANHLQNGKEAAIYIPKGTVKDGTYYVDLKVVFSDGATSVLHHLDLEDFSSCTLLLQGKVGYITYQGTAAKRMVSTLELQVYYYNKEDPDAAARDAAEEEEEKRRLEKLEEDLKSAEAETDNTSNSTSSTSNSSSSSTSNSNDATNDNVQGADVEDVPLEDFDSDGREYFDSSDDSDS